MGLRRISPAVIAALAVIGVVLTVTTAGLLSVYQSVPSSGTINSVNVGVYSDSGCTQNCTSLNWGSISPGNNATETVYVKNTGNQQVTLNMTTTTWSPAGANGPIALTWNQEGAMLSAGQVANATLTLSVSSGISGVSSFSFNIVITGTA